MTREEARNVMLDLKEQYINVEIRLALDMAIEVLNAKCPTCKRCSDHQESGTRCPIKEHYVLPKDGFCHLYVPYKAESEDKECI